jgi:hypothetical protein
MIRNSNVRFVKPMLEQLEDRIQPSFLLGGAVQQLATPLNNMVTDMNNASTDLQAQFTLIKNNTAPANTYSGAEVVETKAVADWQRILNDSAAINATVPVLQTFIQTAAFSEFQAGDKTDVLVLFFGSFLGINPLQPLTATVTQANNILNNSTLQSIVNTNLNSLDIHVDSTTPISQVTVAPSF